MSLIGITGPKYSGKNTTADLIGEEYGRFWRTVGFADPLKEICRQVYDFSEEQLNGSLKEAEDRRYPRPHARLRWYEWHFGELYRLLKGKPYRPRGPLFLTPRYAMQQLGEQWGRNCFSRTWIEKARRTWTKYLEAGLSVGVTDLRYPNEAQAITDDAGYVVMVHRPGTGGDTHGSETEMRKIDPDTRFHNDGSIADLRHQVRRWLEEEVL